MKSYFSILTLLALPLLLVVGYAFFEGDLPNEKFALEKVNIDDVRDMLGMKGGQEASADSINRDSVALRTRQGKKGDTADAENADTTRQKILFVGDSMLEGLGARLRQYAFANDYDMTLVCWYSSTTKTWAKTDTLQYFIRKEKPTYIFVCLGSNEQFVNDLTKREKYIDNILTIIGKTPYIWICPPAWRKDHGINELIHRKVGDGRFFDSRLLTYERRSDNVHPTTASAAKWMDKIVKWLGSNEACYPLRIKPVKNKGKQKGKGIYLKPSDI